MRRLKIWMVLLIAAATIALAVLWSERVPAVVAATASPTTFSAARAWPTLEMLADSIGPRVTGTPGADRALAWLATRARAIPGVEVEIQDVTGARSGDANVLIAYRTKNLLVRIPGRTTDAVLVSSHYDSPTSSVGAADAGMAVAAMIEMISNIAVGPKLTRTVIFNINGAEEQGLLGAHGFLRHPWAADARVFIDLESAGTANKAILFQTGPGHSWLAKRYSAAAPHPYGTVLGQDIFQSGAIPSATDFEIYRDGPGIPGVDIAFYRNGFAYHTQLDRTWNLQRGSLQHIGANALALTRALAEGEIPATSASRAVYYDVLGMTMLSYDESTAVILSFLAIALAIIAVIVASRRIPLRVSDIAFGFGISLAAWLIGFALAILFSLLPVVIGRPHSWFAHPVLPFTAYAMLALAPLIALHGLIGRRRTTPGQTFTGAAWTGALIFMTLLLVPMTILRIGSGYLLLWWVAPAAIGLIVFAMLPEGRRTLAALALIPGAVLTMQAAVLLLEFRSIGGRMPLAVPFDVVMAAIVATITLLLATLPVTLLHANAWPRRAALIVVAVGVIALLIGAFRFPYSELRPQRLAISHRESIDSSALRIAGFDYVGPRAALSAFKDARVAPNGTRRRGPYVVAAPASGLAPASVSLRAPAQDSASGERTLLLHIEPSDAYAHQLSVPAARFVRWIAADPFTPEGPARAGADAIAQLVSSPDTGWTIGVVVRGNEPVTVTASAIRAETTPAARDFIAKLPPWTSSYATAVTRRSFTF